MIGMSTDFDRLLWRELQAAGLVPEPANHQRVMSGISQRGAEIHSQLVEVVGKRTWQRALAALKRSDPDADCRRILGFGDVLTEFFIAPLPLPASERANIASLGALANLIVSIYDGFLDLPNEELEPLPRRVLYQAIETSGGRLPFLTGLFGPASSRCVMRLVLLYFRRLEQFPYSREHSRVKAHLVGAILRMYEAEAATRKKGESPHDHTLAEKAALPFVVMGLPAWLCLPEICPQRFGWHGRWLRRLGEFFGWVDDAIDLGIDLAAGQPNRLPATLAKLRGKGQTDLVLARKIATEGAAILEDWRREMGGQSHLLALGEEVFRTAIVSWFGREGELVA